MIGSDGLCVLQSWVSIWIPGQLLITIIDRQRIMVDNAQTWRNETMIAGAELAGS